LSMRKYLSGNAQGICVFSVDLFFSISEVMCG
jgi:hypothetical protein